MLREERNQNHIKYSNSEKVEKEWKTKGNKDKSIKQKTVINMVNINPTISIISLNVNDLHTPVKERDYIRVDKKMTQLYVVHKEPTLNIKTQMC